MFRIVTEFVQQPTLLLLCDHRFCGCFATKTLPAGLSEAERSAAVEPFVGETSAAGWVIAIDQHLCPNHVRRLRDSRRLVEVPQGFRL